MAPLLCYVTNRAALPTPETDALLAAVRRAVAAGVDWIQIREKDLSGRTLAALARDAVTAAGGSSTRVVVNGRLDVALAAHAAGVHLGGDALPLADVAAWCAQQVPGFAARNVRRDSDDPGAGLPRLRSGQVSADATSFLLGASCHSLAEAQAAERHGAHYISFGPVYSTPSKSQFGPPQGPARLAEVCRTVCIPVVAVGGVTLENAHECLRAGAAGIAAIRLFQESEDLAGLAGTLHAL